MTLIDKRKKTQIVFFFGAKYPARIINTQITANRSNTVRTTDYIKFLGNLKA